MIGGRVVKLVLAGRCRGGLGRRSAFCHGGGGGRVFLLGLRLGGLFSGRRGLLFCLPSGLLFGLSSGLLFGGLLFGGLLFGGLLSGLLFSLLLGLLLGLLSGRGVLLLGLSLRR